MLRIGHIFTILDSVDSTNNYAMAQVHSGSANHGICYLGLHQTAGKGQRGKQWTSKAGENIALSVILEPGTLLLSQQFLLSAAVALSCFDLIKDYAGIETKIKWPNDVYWRDRKAGGILIENVVLGLQWQYAIVGIGLNVNQSDFPKDLPNPVSLKQISSKTYDIKEMAKQLCDCLEKRFGQLQNDMSVNVINDYNDVLYKRNETARFKHNNALFDARIIGVSKQGRLITKNGIEQEFNVGEVEWVVEGR